MAGQDVTASNPMVVRGIDRVLTVQRPVVLAHIRAIRRGRPTATPAEVIRILEKRYLLAVTTGGAAVGAAAVIPAVGVGASLALSGVETAGFLEASALFAQSVTEVHGFVVDDPDRARALVMTMVLGSAGTDLLQQLAGQVSGGPTRSTYWGETITKSLPRAVVGPLADRIKRTFIKKFSVAQGTNVVGRLIPFGIGAVIGGGGNHLLGRQVVRSSRLAFPAPPEEFPETLTPRERPVKAPRERAVKAPREPRRTRAPRELIETASGEIGTGERLTGAQRVLASLPRRRSRAVEGPSSHPPQEG